MTAAAMDGDALDGLISRLLEPKKGRGVKHVALREDVIRNLCAATREVLLSRPNLVIEAPIKICGGLCHSIVEIAGRSYACVTSEEVLFEGDLLSRIIWSFIQCWVTSDSGLSESKNKKGRDASGGIHVKSRFAVDSEPAQTSLLLPARRQCMQKLYQLEAAGGAPSLTPRLVPATLDWCATSS